MSDEILSAIAALDTKLTARIDAVGADLTSHLDAIQRDLKDILPRVANLEDSMATLRAMLTQHHEDSIVPLGAAERAEHIALSARDENRLTAEIVSSLVRQIRTLRERVDALYVGRGGAPQQDAP